MRLFLESLDERLNPSTITPKVPPALWQQLAADVQVLAEGTTLPSSSSVQNLVSVVKAATADGTITPREEVEIATAAEAVLASANIPVSQVQAVVADAEAIAACWTTS